MNYLPVLSYPGETSMPGPPDSTDLKTKAHDIKASAQLAGAATRLAKPPSGLKKPPSQLKPQSKPVKPIYAAEARSKSVYHAMERLLEQGAFSDADLLQAVTSLSGDEFLQVAEERALAGMCGNPRCAHGLLKQKPSAHYKVQGQVVYNMEDELSVACSKKCQAVINMIAQKLGNEDAALFRFTHPTKQAIPPATPPVTLSNTVIERDPSLHPSQRASGQHTPTSHASGQQSMQQAESQQASQSSSQVPSQGGVSAGTRKRSKAGLQYAAGNAKVPIMLAEIKEKDPSAAEAFAAANALKKQNMQGEAGDQTAAHAVDGFVSKIRHTRAPSNAPIAQKGPHFQQHRNQQEGVNAMGPADRHDPQCTSSSQRAVPSTSPELPTGARISLGKVGLRTTSEQQSQLQQLQQQQPQQQQSLQHLPQLQQQQHQQENTAESSVLAGSATTDVPILSFEIDDAEGPLEGASNGLASQFGRLKVIGPDRQPEVTYSPPSAGAHQQSLSQHYQEPPSQDQDYSSENDQEEETDHAESEGTAADDGEDNSSTWLADPPPDFQNRPSPFGAIYMLLETWPTQSTRDYLDSETGASRQLRQSQMLGTSQEILKTMSRVFARVVPSIIQQMQIRVPRSTVEQHLHELLASMHFATPIPAIKDSHWQVLVLVLMKGLSIKRVFSLQDTFESRNGLMALKSLLDASKFTDEMFDALLEVLMEG